MANNQTYSLSKYKKTQLETLISEKIIEVVTPPQGFSSKVNIIHTQNRKYAVKEGKDFANEIIAREILKTRNIPLPKILFHNKTYLVMEAIDALLLDQVAPRTIPYYVPDILQTLKILHEVHDKTKDTTKFKDTLLNKFNGSSIDWHSIFSSPQIDKPVVSPWIEVIQEKIHALKISKPLSFLHTDINQRNIFVNKETKKVVSIIDWEESLFGDPLYDIARVMMLLWHYGYSDSDTSQIIFYNAYTKKEQEKIDIYFLLRVVEYLAWYVKEGSQFSINRILKHQELLKERLETL